MILKCILKFPVEYWEKWPNGVSTIEEIAIESDDEGEDESTDEWDTKLFENDLTLLFAIIRVGEYLQMQKMVDSESKIISSTMVNQAPREEVRIMKVHELNDV